MAIKKDMTTPQGFDAIGAYGKVSALSLNGKDAMSFSLSWFKDQNNLTPFFIQQFTSAYLLNGSNPLAQAYEYLKTLPEFAGATDC
jgi:hypothetical protein